MRQLVPTLFVLFFALCGVYTLTKAVVAVGRMLACPRKKRSDAVNFQRAAPTNVNRFDAARPAKRARGFQGVMRPSPNSQPVHRNVLIEERAADDYQTNWASATEPYSTPESVASSIESGSFQVDSSSTWNYSTGATSSDTNWSDSSGNSSWSDSGGASDSSFGGGGDFGGGGAGGDL